MENKDRMKEESFKRLAEKRVNTAIVSLRKISNLSNRNNYSYTQDQINKITRALKAEVSSIQAAFSGKNRSDEFRLD